MAPPPALRLKSTGSSISNPSLRRVSAFYAYDQPGFGRTENPTDLSIEYRVTHAKAFIDALKLDRYHVIGNSVGGYIAARLALEDSRVGRFVTTTSGTLAPKGSANRKRWDSSTPKSCASMCPAWIICVPLR